jgi:hypothetical protein
MLSAAYRVTDGHMQEINPLTGHMIPATNNQVIIYRPPRQSQALTWKSPSLIAEEEYRRIAIKVKRVAPKLFDQQDGDAASRIFPQTPAEWVHFKYDMCGLRAEELEENADKMLGMIDMMQKIPKQQRQLKPVFGQDAKVFQDGRGPVLALPTIWSIEHEAAGKRLQAPWPTHAELLANGDNRESINKGVRCGRYLPPPRYPAYYPNQPFEERHRIKQHSLDRTGPIFDRGPDPVEVYYSNMQMNGDETFEDEAWEKLQHADFKEKEVGIPNWQIVLNAPPVNGAMADLVREFGELSASTTMG